MHQKIQFNLKERLFVLQYVSKAALLINSAKKINRMQNISIHMF